MPTLPRPPGHHSITPSVVVENAAKVITFLEQAFGARIVDRWDGPDGAVLHAELMIGDSAFMLGEAQGEWKPMPASLSYYVDDADAVDATYRRAVDAGGKSMAEPKNEFYGYRSARVQDAGGNVWTICAVIEEVSREEMERRMAEMMKGG